LALACDMIIAAESARFADTHARVGVMPGGGMSARLPRAIGIRKAKEMSLKANYLSAVEAERIGLVNRVVPDDRLMAEALELAKQILGADQKIVRGMKALYDLTTRNTLEEALRIEQEHFRAFNSGSKLSDFDNRRAAVMERGRTQTRS
jgi:enoyl-CoA hydratase/carnithine racemase